MAKDREEEIRDEIGAVLAKLRVQEFALLELLRSVSSEQAARLANGLRARVNEWALDAGPQFTPRVDQMASEQLASLLGALDEPPTMPAQLQLEIPDRRSTPHREGGLVGSSSDSTP